MKQVPRLPGAAAVRRAESLKNGAIMVCCLRKPPRLALTATRE